MKVVITGGTGFIGRNLCGKLSAAGYKVVALTRNAAKAAATLGSTAECISWDGMTSGEWCKEIDGAEAVINLAGANLADKPWTNAYKKIILDSRINAGKAIAQAIQSAAKKPAVLLQGSAIGIYGNGGEETINEESPFGNGFLADVVQRWEASVEDVATTTRLVFLRTGVVLGAGEGTLAKMELPFKWCAGGPPGGGKQWFSWVHIEDTTDSIQFLLENKNVTGAFNLTAPNPTQMGTFCKELANALNRPSWLPVPAFALRALLGEMAEETVLASQNVLPQRLLEAGFKFKFENVADALNQIYSE